MQDVRKIVIIGGGACGPKAAARVRRLDPKASIIMLQDEDLVSYAGCGLPYYISGMVKARTELIVRNASAFKRINNVDVLLRTRVDKIDRASHKVHVTNLSDGTNTTHDYDKLVISTGASPVVPPLDGIKLKGVHVLKRVPDAEDIIALIAASELRKAVIVGAGLIGVEMAEALVAKGMDVTIVEALDKVLAALLDDEISDLTAKHMLDHGVKLKLGQKIVSFEGVDGKVRRATTDKETLDCDLAIVAIGVRPDTKLAREAGLKIGRFGDIEVNEYMQTSDPNIYAGGDCVANLNLVTGQKAFVPMGSTANKHGHVIANNICGVQDKFPGIVSTACVKIFHFNVGRVGIGEKQARELGYNAVTVLVPGPDKPEYYSGNKEIVIKLIVDSQTRRILGGQGTGPGDVIKRIDVLATAISMGMTVDMLANLDLAYAPPYNGALDVLHHAANLAINKIDGRTQSLKPAEVKEKLEKDSNFMLLDVRSHMEAEHVRLEKPQEFLLPQPKLISEIDKLPRDKEIVVTCRRGGRAYQSACILKGAGFKHVKFMEGGITCWCDKVEGKHLL
jgi:NADPH-dependent 2,4-dienoyl-CoA reductase/sulfur reductase-like enzyme/rhodanese-related sulfurtransferase